MRRPRSTGFTLLEVLVALALFTMVALPLLEIELRSTAQVARVSQGRRAQAAVNLVLVRLLADPSHGDRTDRQDGFEVRSHTDSVANQVGVERIQVAAYLDSEKLAEVSSYRAWHP